MAKFRAKGKKWWASLSKDELDELTNKNDMQIKNIQLQIDSTKKAIIKADELAVAIVAANKEISALEKLHINGIGGLVKKIVGDENRISAQRKVDSLKIIVSNCYSELLKPSGSKKYLETELKSLQNKLITVTNYNEVNRRRIDILNKKESVNARRIEKANITKALAAAHIGKSRTVATSVRSQLEKFDSCPYCNDPLGENPNADHIFPIIYGGLSVKENMVFVCEFCNGKKGSLLLREFCIKFNLDRDRIERILASLGKRF